ncbi:MAG TPA: GtrA family protein [Solirubrobacteraceae bacterium]|jgi:dolichol-phosphate mannosyltransferase
MRDDATAMDLSGPKVPGLQAGAPLRPHIRLLHGMRRPENWVQLIQFGAVGAIGFLINLGVFALCEKGLGLPYLVAYVIAWLVAVTNNFLVNRRWTFNEHAQSSRIHFQALRFVLVSAVAAAIGAGLLALMVEVGDVSKMPAEAIAVLASTPLNFLGNKLWSFRPKG